MAAPEAYDLLLIHLEHPLFQIPIISFIEQHSVVFSPDLSECEEYHKIHKEYQDIVTGLLESFRTDIGLTHDQVLTAVNNINRDRSDILDFFKGIEHVLAVEDFAVFVRLMQQANIELQEQALAILQQQFAGILAPDRPVSANSSEDDDVIAMVVGLSKAEYDKEMSMRKASNELEQGIRASSQATFVPDRKKVTPDERVEPASRHLRHEEPPIPHARLPLTEVPPVDRKASHKTKQPVDSWAVGGGGDRAVVSPPPLQPTSSRVDSKQAAADWLASAKEESSRQSGTASQLAATMGGMNAEEIAARQAFLREQRDKLVAKKQADRERQLAAAEESTRGTRPASARTARLLMAGKAEESAQSTNSRKEEEKKLAMRRAIAEKLKAEVVYK